MTEYLCSGVGTGAQWVKPLLGMPGPHSGVPGLGPGCSVLLIQLLADEPGRKQVLAQVPVGDQAGILAPGFSLTQP